MMPWIVDQAGPQLIGDAVLNDGPGLILVVEKFPWANTLEVARAWKERCWPAPP